MSRQSGRQDADGRTKGLGRSKKDNPIPIGRSNGRFGLNLTVPRPTSSRRLSEPCPYGHSCATKRTQVCRPAGAGLPANGHRNARKPPKGPRKQERPTPATEEAEVGPGRSVHEKHAAGCRGSGGRSSWLRERHLPAGRFPHDRAQHLIAVP